MYKIFDFHISLNETVFVEKMDIAKLEILLGKNKLRMVLIVTQKMFAPGEARTHGLQIMRLTRCRLRYRGLVI